MYTISGYILFAGSSIRSLCMKNMHCTSVPMLHYCQPYAERTDADQSPRLISTAFWLLFYLFVLSSHAITGGERTFSRGW
jgi:hypothetical protein